MRESRLVVARGQFLHAQPGVYLPTTGGAADRMVVHIAYEYRGKDYEVTYEDGQGLTLPSTEVSMSSSFFHMHTHYTHKKTPVASGCSWHVRPVDVRRWGRGAGEVVKRRTSKSPTRTTMTIEMLIAGNMYM